MPIDIARYFTSLPLPKAGLKAGACAGLTSLWLLVGAGSVHDATAENDTRTLSFHHTHSNEDLTVTFKRDGRYDEEALKQLNHYLRDWRSQDQTVMDPHLFDIIWEVYRDVDGKQPIQIVSAYRSPATNAMLRHRSAHSGVARFSQHMLGHAMDLYIPSVPLEQIRFAGLRLQRGGVGFYPTSGSPFVHLDTGNIRHWPRMTHDQLVKVFPDGRTVHVPTDGVPLKGYELAKADIEKRGNGDDAAAIGKPSLLAALFKGGKSSTSSDDDDEAAPDEKPTPAVMAAAAKAAAPPQAPRAKATVPAALQLASADAQLVQMPAAKPETAKPETSKPETSKPETSKSETSKSETGKPETVADVINARGFWDNDTSEPEQSTAAKVIAAISARKALEAADPQSTASTAAVYDAMAYAPPASPLTDRANIVAASAPPQRSQHLAQARNPNNGTAEIDTVATKRANPDEQVVNATRPPATRGSDVWLRIVMLAPSATTAMSVTMMGDTDMTQMRTFFVKPQSSIPMTFSADPMHGLSTDHFSGSAFSKVELTTFTLRTALLK
ncbi:MAG: DUF882 domain-containing protein [Bradyrhizobium sp.]|nr:DUF882 domain-containing protein [Bradyrhizobium sp.]